jgi:hypothetical protein
VCQVLDMSSWASRLSTSAKSASSSPAKGRRSDRQHADVALSSPSSVVASPLNSGPCAGIDAPSPDVREEFRRVAEKFNEESAYMLRIPPDCWDLLTQYLSYVDVVALGQTCRTLWVILHERESVWWRQLAYFHHDVRDLRGGKLLCTAALFPKPPAGISASQSESLVPSPTTAPSSSTVPPAADARPCSFASQPRRSDWVPMSAYERFFQERRVYVLDAHREWHFQELADVEDKATGMFTVALHDGKADGFASPLSVDPASFSFSASVTPPPILAAIGSTRDALLNVPLSPNSLVPSPSSGGPASQPTPHRRTTPNQTPGTSASNSPALPPSPAPPTPPLLPRVGDPIINDHNPLLQLRIYAIDVHGAKKRGCGGAAAEEEEEAVEDNYVDGNGGNGGAPEWGRSNQPYGGHSSPPANDTPANLAGMSEEEVLAYVMQLSLQEAQESAAATAEHHSPVPARTTPPAESPHSAYNSPNTASKSATDPMCWPQTHYRGTPGSASLPLSELLAVIDSINNSAFDQLHHHQVRDCTAAEEPEFLHRLAETLRSAKHRRLHLGNHHRAVRNNGQTTRNRTGRSGGAVAPTSLSVSVASAGAGGAGSQQQQPPPMNRMLRGFHGDLLEITEREARMVTSKLLGKPNMIDEFVVFRCYNPAELYRRLCPVTSTSQCAEAAASTAGLQGSPASTKEVRHVMKNGMLVSVPAPLYADPTPAATAPLSLTPENLTDPSPSHRTVMRGPSLKALPFFTRFFVAPELCHDGFIALLIVDVVRVLVVVDKEVISTDSPDWESPLIGRSGRMVVPGHGYNPQAYRRSDYNYVPPNPPRRRRSSN